MTVHLKCDQCEEEYSHLFDVSVIATPIVQHDLLDRPEALVSMKEDEAVIMAQADLCQPCLAVLKSSEGIEPTNLWYLGSRLESPEFKKRASD